MCIRDRPGAAGSSVTKISAEATADIKFGYCTEFIILTEKEFTEADESEFKAYLESIGDSIVCVADDDVVKIHAVSYTHLDVYKRQIYAGEGLHKRAF